MTATDLDPYDLFDAPAHPSGTNPEPAPASRVTIPDVDGLDACAAALAYAKGGCHVVPVKRASKHPGSVVGRDWPRLSTTDERTIIGRWAATDHGIAIHAGRSGLVVFDVDDPAAIPEPLARAITETSPPFQVSRPGSDRGHYLFLAPAGRRIGNGTGALGGAWGQVRGTNGVIITAPSVHENADEGGAYAWRRTGPVPELPTYVANLLPEGAEADQAATSADVKAFLDQHTAAARPELVAGWCTSYDRQIAAGASRHDTAVSMLCGALREAAAGYIPARTVEQALRGRFTAAATDATHQGHQRAPHAAADEWAGIVSWAVAQARTADPADTRRRLETKMPAANIEIVPRATLEPPPGIAPATGEIAPAPADDRNLPAAFWQARPHLAEIRDLAHSASLSADAVLGAVLARVAATTPPTIQLPAPIGTAGTLDLLVAFIGSSGAGKSSASRLAAEYLPITDERIFVGPLGSGEGAIDAYFDFVTEEGDDGKKRKVKRQTRLGALFSLDEGQALGEVGGRKGSTIMPTIRSAWTGDTLGQTNASEDRKRHLAARSYRFALLSGFQLEHATVLIDDAAGGTPQRFLYLSATDPTIPAIDETPPTRPPAIEWQPPVHQLGPMDLDAQVAHEIRARHIAKARGDIIVPALDAHRDLSRLKVAGLLALLDDRLAITAEDWTLAGVMLDTSDRVRSAIAAAAAARAAAAEDSAIRRKVRSELASRDAVETTALDRAADVIARAIHRHGGDGTHQGADGTNRGCTKSCATRSLSARHRKEVAVDEALDHALGKGLIVQLDNHYRPGDRRPA